MSELQTHSSQREALEATKRLWAAQDATTARWLGFLGNRVTSDNEAGVSPSQLRYFYGLNQDPNRANEVLNALDAEAHSLAPNWDDLTRPERELIALHMGSQELARLFGHQVLAAEVTPAVA